MVGKRTCRGSVCDGGLHLHAIKGATSIGSSRPALIKLLGEDATSISERIVRFEAAKAQCRHDRDRQAARRDRGFVRHDGALDELVVKVFNEQVIGVKGLQRQIDTLRRQTLEQQEAMRRDTNRELEARTQVRMLTDKLAAVAGLATNRRDCRLCRVESAPVTLPGPEPSRGLSA